ncbi:LRRN4 C-terminal-like protein [Pristis pectinata]|uniref:LRRN4 C-terminal-like protein n=1 Tax=Pristis pectinata TaxID=685728 RepID=UPI00223D7D52|nr:LRRN4 C-terminal-like protein [Pristis pectinata]
MEGMQAKIQRSKLSSGDTLSRYSAVFVFLACVGVASWKQTASAPLSPGTTDWPATSVQLPNLNQSRESPGPVTSSWRTTRRRFIRFTLNNDEYEDYEEEEATPPPTRRGPLPRCDYNPCSHMQVPCEELQRAQPCLCPGISGEDIPPEQPRIRRVTGTSDSEASVHWCEPSSVVSGYRLVFWPEGASENVTTQLIPSRQRLFTLAGLEAATTYVVCVLAFNPAGASQLTKRDLDGADPGAGPCLVFATGSTRRLILYIGVTICLLVLLSVLCVLLRCLCAKHRDPPTPSSVALGLRNPIYEHDKGTSQS